MYILLIYSYLSGVIQIGIHMVLQKSYTNYINFININGLRDFIILQSRYTALHGATQPYQLIRPLPPTTHARMG
jgi:hypothetical protein